MQDCLKTAIIFLLCGSLFLLCDAIPTNLGLHWHETFTIPFNI